MNRYGQFESQLGEIFVAINQKEELIRLIFLSGTEKHKAQSWQGIRDDSAIQKVAGQINDFFAGKQRLFSLPLAPQGTDFQQKVWQALLKIPFGETRSYGEIAQQIGLPKAAQAVGRANGSNPIPLVIPCHRVIGKNGQLVGYTGGLRIKEQLLDFEKAK